MATPTVAREQNKQEKYTLIRGKKGDQSDPREDKMCIWYQVCMDCLGCIARSAEGSPEEPQADK